MLSVESIHQLLMSLKECGAKLGHSLTDILNSRLKLLITALSSDTDSLLMATKLYMRKPKDLTTLKELNKKLGELFQKANDVFELDRNRYLAVVLKSYTDLVTQACYFDLLPKADELKSVLKQSYECLYKEHDQLLEPYSYFTPMPDAVGKTLDDIYSEMKKCGSQDVLENNEFYDRKCKFIEILNLLTTVHHKPLKKSLFYSAQWNNLVDGYRLLFSTLINNYEIHGDDDRKFISSIFLSTKDTLKTAYDILLEINHDGLMKACKEYSKWVAYDMQCIQNRYDESEKVIRSQRIKKHTNDNDNKLISAYKDKIINLSIENKALKEFKAISLKNFGIFRSALRALNEGNITHATALDIYCETTKKLNLEVPSKERNINSLTNVNHNSVPEVKQYANQSIINKETVETDKAIHKSLARLA